METVITTGSNGLPHHFTDLRGWTATKVTPWKRNKPATWSAFTGKVRAFVTTPALNGTDLAFGTRDQVLTFIRCAMDGHDLLPIIYGGGYDDKGDFLVVGTRAKSGRNYKLVIEQTEEAAA